MAAGCSASWEEERERGGLELRVCWLPGLPPTKTSNNKHHVNTLKLLKTLEQCFLFYKKKKNIAKLISTEIILCIVSF